MPYVRKTKDYWEVQGNYGYGDSYECVTAADTRKEAQGYLKDYRQNEPGIPFRIVKKRECIEPRQKGTQGQ